MSDNTSVKVAVRIRPLVPSEISKGCREILDVVEENEQIIVRSTDKDKPFTFNYVLPSSTPQEELYKRCVQPLIGNLFKGYNVTILAYGQTGSGKTHSMGTAFKGEDDMGVIPRAVAEIFEFIKDNFALDFTVTVSFMELYQEVLYDLLSNKARDQCTLEIREDTVKGIHIPNLTEVPVQSAIEVLDSLTRGSIGRVTGSTAMNAQSSRSHAIFTVNISINNKNNCRENKQAKLHLVDLAGSERPKKTGAAGNTFKEGVHINKGLFVLGNVISCLGDEKAQHGFIPYRDSNLTRLLKDSLGGNSITLMIACVSPADYNFEETLSTLRYADRARKIKNKPIVNQDAKVAEINDLKKTIQHLRLQIVGQGGPIICPAEIELLKKEIVDLKLKIRDLTVQLSAALIDKTGLHEKIMILQNANEGLNKKILDLKCQYDITFHNISTGLETNDTNLIKENLTKMQQIQSQFLEINSEQKKTEAEIRNHEESLNKHLMSPPTNHADSEIQEKEESHTTRQMALNSELLEIQKQLILKESLAVQLASNNQYMVDYKAMADNEAKIALLQKEKEELLQQVKNVQAQGASSKIAEQRRKRVQELEAQLQDLHKKVHEQARLIKLKEKDELRIGKLNQEIFQMKQNKVKLVRTMREESEKFRQWKLEKEKECQRLKQQDRKKENEIVKMKAMHTKQQNVFKRRVEEAEALNKRLKNILAVRKQTQDSKLSGKAERIGPWVKQEFDIYVNLVEAEVTLSALLEDRATLQQQLDELRADPETAEGAECNTIAEDIELRSVQIQDLQQKLLYSDEENRSKTRFDKFQSIGEAKFALKLVFEQAAEMQKEKVHTQLKLNELQESFNELQEKLKTSDANYKLREEKNLEHLAQLQKGYEEKVSILLRQLRGVKVEDVSEEDELRQMCKIQQEKIQELEEKIKTIQNRQEFHTPILSSKKRTVPNVIVTEGTFIMDDKENGAVSETDSDDDVENDPDWRKTPLGKRILEEKRKLTLVRNAPSFNRNVPVKRSSEGGCTCKTNCQSSRCGCRKTLTVCGDSCKCSAGTCENRNNEKDTSANSESEDAFKKPRYFDEDEQPRKSKVKSRQLFKMQI
ncbi:chromosome-associated kinesin KIF4 [Anoplophora glabripennis]|uniref:chromosome-associated kinesin KIF4 n=1 Tax=Anoplophora glabripennis TaxID=217634 RepID=UPI00087486F5|nr:chromosome-associated kinesin KIF4 [Anoplophora glabripennis]